MYHLYISLILLFIVIVVYYKFTNKEGFETQEYIFETLKKEDKELCKKILDSILVNINQKFGLAYAKGYIERARITDKGTHTNFLLQVFLYETSSDVNKKVVIDVDLNSDESISINNIRNAGSLEEPIMNNLGESGRGSDLHKSALGNIGANDDSKLEYSEYNIPESKNKMQDRNSWVLTKEAQKLKKDGIKMFPCRSNRHVWDKNGISFVENETDGCKGIYSGATDKPLVPNFYPGMFSDKEDSYHWMFDHASDSASRPVGITGARGSSL